jgi:predicted O-methyltransferase YrrM
VRASNKGHGVHSPFAFTLCEEVFYNRAVFYDFYELESMRKKLQKDDSLLHVEDLGAGSAKFKNTQRRVSDIARHGMSTKKQSEIFYRLINFSGYKSALELGTSLGLNARYLAKATQGPVYTIEGSQDVFDFAQYGLSPGPDNLFFIHGNLDEVLPEILKEIPGLDFVYMDGNHTYAATLRYFEWLMPKMNKRGVIVVDDIYWSPGMTRAWNTMKKDPRVKLSLDLFYFGLLFFQDAIKEKQDLKILI